MRNEMNHDLGKLAQKFTPEAKRALSEFLARVVEVEKQINNTALSVLVWGPGKQTLDNVLYHKRCQIRDKLRLLGNAALFSEEVKKFMKSEMPVALSELAQAISADFIVVVMASWGAVTEVAKYGFDTAIGSKMLVLVPEQCRGSFTEQALLSEFHQNVLYFTQEELQRCDLVNKVTDLVPKFKLAKFIYHRQKRRWEAEDKL